MQAMISTSLCKIGSTNKLMVMFDLLTILLFSRPCIDDSFKQKGKWSEHPISLSQQFS